MYPRQICYNDFMDPNVATEQQTLTEAVNENELKYQIGERLRKLRMALRMRVVDVQKITGMDYRTLSHYEPGRADIPITRLIRLVNTYQADLLWVLAGESTPGRFDLDAAREHARVLYNMLVAASVEDNPIVNARIRLRHKEAEARGRTLVEEMILDTLGPELIDESPSTQNP